MTLDSILVTLGGHAFTLFEISAALALLVLLLLIVAVVMTIEEISQIWIPSRTFDLGDLAANYVGILLAEWRARCATARRSATIDSGAES